MKDFFLSSIENDIRIDVEVTEVEYDRAEGAQISFHVKHPVTSGSFHGFWWSRLQIKYFVEEWGNSTGNAQFREDGSYLKFTKSDYSNNRAVGFRIEQSFGRKLKDFPLSLSFSFEVTESCVKNFMEQMKKLEARCRPY